MGEWQRLTPENEDIDESQITRYRHIGDDSFFPHQLEGGCESMQMTNAEALAFARQLPEIKALVVAAKGLREFIRLFDMGGEWRQENYPAIKAYNQAIAPFEEADGD